MSKKAEEKKQEILADPSKLKNQLYNMTAEQASIYYDIDQADGEITPEIEKRLEVHEANVLGRAFSMKAIITRFQDKAELAKAKKAEFAAIQKACEKAVIAGKAYIRSFLDPVKNKKLEYGTETISLRKTPDAVTITDEKLIPDQYKRFKVTLTSQHLQMLQDACEFAEIDMPAIVPEIDKAKIKANYKLNKVEVAGTEITSDFSVQLKG